MSFNQTSGFGKIRYDISEQWNIEANANLTHYKSANPGPVSSPVIDNDMNIMRGTAAASLYNLYDKTNGGVTYFFNWVNHNIIVGYASS